MVERPVRGDGQAAAFVGGGDEPQLRLGAGVVQRGEPDLVQDHQVVAEKCVDDLAGGVVGQPAVEGLDEIGCGAVLHPVSGGHRCVPEGYQGVRLSRAGRANDSDVGLATEPFQAREVVERGLWMDDTATSNPSMVMTTGNAALSRAAAFGGVPGGDLGLDQGAEQLYRGPALGSAVSSTLLPRAGCGVEPAQAGEAREPPITTGQRCSVTDGHSG